MIMMDQWIEGSKRIEAVGMRTLQEYLIKIDNGASGNAAQLGEIFWKRRFVKCEEAVVQLRLALGKLHESTERSL